MLKQRLGPKISGNTDLRSSTRISAQSGPQANICFSVESGRPDAALAKGSRQLSLPSNTQQSTGPSDKAQAIGSGAWSDASLFQHPIPLMRLEHLRNPGPLQSRLAWNGLQRHPITAPEQRTF